jgi:CysZ protein
MGSPPDFLSSSLNRRLTYGLSLPARAANMMLTRRELWPYVAIPISLCAVLIIASSWATLHWGTELTRTFVSAPEASGWLADLGRTMWWITNAVVHAVLFGFLTVMSWFLAGILASPIYDRLSARVESLELGTPWTDDGGFTEALDDVWLGIQHTLLGVSLYLSLWCPMLLLNLVPVFGEIAYVVLGGAVSAFFVAREGLDYSLSRRRFSFRQKLNLMWAHLAVVEGLGLASLVLMWIPLANFISMPVAVIAGTLLYCDLEESGVIEA